MAEDRPAVEVIDWTSEWAARFDQARRELAPVLPESATIEHFGSTSVPGLAAKPIIDLLVVTDQVPALLADHVSLESLGYFYIARYFADDHDHLCFGRDHRGRRTEHLHVFHPRSPWPQHNRDFRDYLRANPEEAEVYGLAKSAAAIRHPESRADYSDAKAEVVRSLRRKAQEWAGRATT